MGSIELFVPEDKDRVGKFCCSGEIEVSRGGGIFQVEHYNFYLATKALYTSSEMRMQEIPVTMATHFNYRGSLCLQGLAWSTGEAPTFCRCCCYGVTKAVVEQKRILAFTSVTRSNEWKSSGSRDYRHCCGCFQHVAPGLGKAVLGATTQQAETAGDSREQLWLHAFQKIWIKFFMYSFIRPGSSYLCIIVNRILFALFYRHAKYWGL